MAKSRNYQEQAYLYLKDAIEKQVILPNAHLKEIDLSQELKMSRTPIRKALLRLQKEGYVDIYPYRGAVVANRSLNGDELIDRFKFLELFASHLFNQLDQNATHIDQNKVKQLETRVASNVIPEGGSRFDPEVDTLRFLADYYANRYFKQLVNYTLDSFGLIPLFNQKKAKTRLIPEKAELDRIAADFFASLKEEDYPMANKQFRRWINRMILFYIES